MGSDTLPSQNPKCQDLPKFQFSGGGSDTLPSENPKCQDLPKFQFSGGGGCSVPRVGHSQNFEPNFQPLQLATASQIVSHILLMWRLITIYLENLEQCWNFVNFNKKTWKWCKTWKNSWTPSTWFSASCLGVGTMLFPLNDLKRLVWWGGGINWNTGGKVNFCSDETHICRFWFKTTWKSL